MSIINKSPARKQIPEGIINSIPNELIFEFVKRLPEEGLRSLACVSKHFQQVATDKRLWQPRLESWSLKTPELSDPLTQINQMLKILQKKPSFNTIKCGELFAQDNERLAIAIPHTSRIEEFHVQIVNYKLQKLSEYFFPATNQLNLKNSLLFAIHPNKNGLHVYDFMTGHLMGVFGDRMNFLKNHYVFIDNQKFQINGLTKNPTFFTENWRPLTENWTFTREIQKIPENQTQKKFLKNISIPGYKLLTKSFRNNTCLVSLESLENPEKDFKKLIIPRHTPIYEEYEEYSFKGEEVAKEFAATIQVKKVKLQTHKTSPPFAKKQKSTNLEAIIELEDKTRNVKSNKITGRIIFEKAVNIKPINFNAIIEPQNPTIDVSVTPQTFNATIAFKDKNLGTVEEKFNTIIKLEKEDKKSPKEFEIILDYEKPIKINKNGKLIAEIPVKPGHKAIKAMNHPIEDQFIVTLQSTKNNNKFTLLTYSSHGTLEKEYSFSCWNMNATYWLCAGNFVWFASDLGKLKRLNLLNGSVDQIWGPSKKGSIVFANRVFFIKDLKLTGNYITITGRTLDFYDTMYLFSPEKILRDIKTNYADDFIVTIDLLSQKPTLFQRIIKGK